MEVIEMKVRELMSSPARAVEKDAPLKDVARFLCRHHISGAPVVDDEGYVLGVVSESDIVEKERGSDGPGGLLHRLGPRERRREVTAQATTAGEAMHSPPILADPMLSDYGAAWLMSEHDVNRLPVVDRGKLVGVVSRADLTREFARRDEHLAMGIRHDVIEPLFVPDVSVEVRNGQVVLRGAVDSERDHRALVHAVTHVPGVVSVASEVQVRAPATERS